MNEIEPEHALQENIPDAEKIRKTKRTNPPWSPFERVASLNGQSISWLQVPKSARRCRTRFDLFENDAGIPYVKVGVMARDQGCSLMERQDRMNEEIFARINDLAYRLEDLEQDLQEDRSAK